MAMDACGEPYHIGHILWSQRLYGDHLFYRALYERCTGDAVTICTSVKLTQCSHIVDVDSETNLELGEINICTCNSLALFNRFVSVLNVFF
jgi:hypothetical protein